LVREHAHEADNLILVSHYEYAEQLPTLFGKEELAVEFPELEIGKGRARLIDCAQKTCVTIG